MQLSVVIPVYNEEDNIIHIIEAISNSLENIDYEIIFVDDGSSDKTCQIIHEQNNSRIKLIEFSRNFGQTSAMAAGIEHAEGKYIATIDGDLQNDPSDIPMMIKLLEDQKVDVVAGRRKKRQDGMLLRKIPSKIANYLIRKLTNVNLKDYGCTLKVFKGDIAKRLDLYGELHRFIPILAHINGAKIIEVDVKHHARKYGESKYGIGRTFRVVSDLMLMVFMLKFRQKPMHLFGTLGIISFIISGLVSIYLVTLKVMGQSITDKPLFYLFIITFMSGVQLITTGFIAELVMRTYFESQHKKPYEIKKITKVKK
ncbi:MAG: glycosyltransferase family 2 protein [Alphaproteobacteria bacterium]|nr:glycosyltransferase family 2 protein [Alphaproteobacteria bacterium]OJV15713.1 MAG: glycosyltransferase [Alphaproteobacteria bacterium 33-17]